MPEDMTRTGQRTSTLRLYIGGRWVQGARERVVELRSPATGGLLAQVAQAEPDDVGVAVVAAQEASGRAARLATWERARLCHRVADQIEARADELARELSEEQGKPYLTEALPEVHKTAEGFRLAAEEAKRLNGETIPVEDPHKRVITIRQPRGVYAVITPWNFPMNIPTEYLAPALATGNTIVWKPSSYTVRCAGRLVECMEAAEVPPGIINLVYGPGATVGHSLVSHPAVVGIAVTGDANTGEVIARGAAGKRLLLELGGNGPVIILDDANLEAAARCVSAGSFFNAGQVCSASERVLVARGVHQPFREAMMAAAKSVRLGNPLDTTTTMGPMNNRPTAEKMDRHLQDARAKGAQVVAGGNRASGFPTDLFYEPTILDNVREDMLVFQEETFGPVVPMTEVEDDAAALQVANQTGMGLVASVFTTNLRRAFYFAEGLQAGTVVVNDASTYWELHLPFGGRAGTRSGYGRLGGKHTLMEMTDLKTIAIDLHNG
jgi:acyl-CoA reductase-like NAD-dependent aldehyde dehydrogenase